MFGKNVMKYPVLIMGIMMFGIFLSQDSTKKWWEKQKTRLIPSTCKAVIDRVQKKSPSDWEMECLNTSFLRLTINFNREAKNKKLLRVAMYRELANTYSQFAQFANIALPYVEGNKKKVYNEIETLEHLREIQIILKHKNLQILSQSDGQAVAKFLELKRPELIADHLKLTVTVVEKRF